LINGNSGRITHQIAAKEGKLVLFPGYLLHSTGVNYSSRMRMSLAININEKAKGK
jgi:ectoine hydroxylase-related dioxygenase (phytanoyl-CoA dioxygenase family)